jgi:hypothetical protein
MRHFRLSLLLLCALCALCGSLPSARAETPQDYVSAYGADQCAQIQIIIVAGDVTTIYNALAPNGSAATAAAWQCSKKVVTVAGGTTTIVVTWADGNRRFDNVPGAAGAGLSALSYQ